MVLKNAQKENFNARTVKSTPYGNDEVRFTTNGKNLYIFVLNPAPSTSIDLATLGLNSPQKPGKIRSIKMLGNGKNVDFEQDEQKLRLTLPDKLPTIYTVVLEVKGALD